MVALESHAAGRPVIATDLPGLADLVRPNQTGLVVPPDAPQPLAAAIQRVLDYPAEADAMGLKGRDAVRGYDWRNIAVCHVELYERLTRPAS